jgi:probable rRNA maturation factor
MATKNPPAEERDIAVLNRHASLKLPRGAVERMLSALDRDGRWEVPEGELSVVFVSDEELAGLHDEFLDDPTVTDVITFEGDPLCGSAGEICVSVDRAVEVAAELKVPVEQELALYVVHGYLHLAGFDDLKPELKRVMRRAEAAAMKVIAEEKLMPAFAFKPKPAPKPKAAKALSPSPVPSKKSTAKGAAKSRGARRG